MFSKILLSRMLLILICFYPASLTRAEEGGHKPDTSKPLSNPDPLRRTVPEIVCTSSKARRTENLTLASTVLENPFRIRIRGNTLYSGATVSDEKFSGLINKTDRLRWTSGKSTLVLDETFKLGAWVIVENNITTVRPLNCQPLDTTKR